MEDNSQISLPKWFKWVGSILAVFALIAIGIYLYYFARNGFGNPEEFAWFGDYVGGLIGPILTFITICLLIWSIHIQRDDLKHSTEELRKSSEALIETQMTHKISLDLQKRELCRKEIQDTFEFQYKHTLDLFALPIYQVLNFTKKASIITLDKAIHRDFPLNKEKSFIQAHTLHHIHAQLKNDSYALHNSVVLEELDYLVSLLVELNKVTSSEYVKISFSNRVKKLVNTINTTKLISENQYQNYINLIKGTHVPIIEPVEK